MNIKGKGFNIGMSREIERTWKGPHQSFYVFYEFYSAIRIDVLNVLFCLDTILFPIGDITLQAIVNLAKHIAFSPDVQENFFNSF